jgi:hypothetical protein
MKTRDSEYGKNLIERKEMLQKLEDELKELDSYAEHLQGGGDIKNFVTWNKYYYRTHAIERHALLSKIFVAQKDIELEEENNRFRKECRRVYMALTVLRRIEKMAIDKNSKIATLISEEIAKKEWENEEGHKYKLKGE